MKRSTFLKGIATGLAAPALSIPVFGQITKTAQQNRFDAFSDALSQKPWLRGFVGTQQIETRTQMQTVYGALPSGLRGALYRNGPAYHDIGGERFGHWFDAPGMIQKYAIKGNIIEHHGRFIATPRNCRELNENKMLFSAFGTGGAGLSSGGSADNQNTGNIHVTQHAGELMALWEAGSPYILDPDTLETKGKKVWSEEIESLPFSAHTRHDHDGSLWSIGYSAIPGGLVLYHISADGELINFGFMPMEVGGMMHDFVLTDTKLVVMIPPYLADKLEGEHFLDRYSWYGDQPVKALVFDKSDLSLIREIELDPFWVFHFGNAYDASSDEIVCDFAMHDDVTFMEDDAFAFMDGSWDGHVSTGLTYAKVRMNIRTGQSILERRPEFGPAEFFRINPQDNLTNHRHTLMLTERDATLAGIKRGENILFGRVVLYDRQSDRISAFSAPATQILEEHLIVPKPRSQDDFWILGTGHDWRAGETFFSVYEGLALEDGPIFQANMDGVLPLGLHGNFIS